MRMEWNGFEMDWHVGQQRGVKGEGLQVLLDFWLVLLAGWKSLGLQVLEDILGCVG